jgi:hypothetical protein
MGFAGTHYVRRRPQGLGVAMSPHPESAGLRPAQHTSHSHRRLVDSATLRITSAADRDRSSFSSPPDVQMCHLSEFNRLPVQQHPPGRPTTAQDPRGSGTPVRGTAGAPAQGAALCAGPGIPTKYPSIWLGRLLHSGCYSVCRSVRNSWILLYEACLTLCRASAWKTRRCTGWSNFQ